jgi:hypothetical protein
VLAGPPNHNPIDNRAKYISAEYVDSRERRLRARYRYGSKVQFERHDRLVNQWRTQGLPGFVDGILRVHLNATIVGTMEKLARDALLTMGTIHTYAGNATSVAGLAASTSYTLNPATLRDVKLKLSVRSKWALQNFGDYANPIPGSNLYLVITTPGVFHSIVDNLNGEFVQRHTALGNQSIMNLDMIEYEGFLFMQSWDAALFNMGPLSKQVAVIEAVNGGDGAPDPDSTAVDNLWYVGQGSSGIKHYVQCSDFGTNDFEVGDFVTLHTARTNSWGVTDGVDVTDGESRVYEVYEVDAVNNRLVFRTPVMASYDVQKSYSSLSGQASSGAAFAFVTKALHVQPAYIFGARGGLRFAMKQPVQIYNPPAFDDYESVIRVTWDVFGEMNRWNTDLWEVHMAVGSWGNRGGVALG